MHAFKARFGSLIKFVLSGLGCLSIADADQRRRQSAAVTRQPARSRSHGLIVTIAGSHRYPLSAAGRRTVTALLATHNREVAHLTAYSGSA